MQNTQVTGKWSFGKVAFYALCLFGLYKVCKKRRSTESVGQCVRTPETVQDRNQEHKEVRKQFEMRLRRVEQYVGEVLKQITRMNTITRKVSSNQEVLKEDLNRLRSQLEFVSIFEIILKSS